MVRWPFWLKPSPPSTCVCVCFSSSPLRPGRLQSSRLTWECIAPPSWCSGELLVVALALGCWALGCRTLRIKGYVARILTWV